MITNENDTKYLTEERNDKKKEAYERDRSRRHELKPQIKQRGKGVKFEHQVQCNDGDEEERTSQDKKGHVKNGYKKETKSTRLDRTIQKQWRK